ncbi:MAG: hypothetical protein ACI8VC_001822 [Candidatus Endobugula sp.]
MNQDNARLDAQVSESRKHVFGRESKITNLEMAVRKNDNDYKIKCRGLEIETANSNVPSEEMAALRDQLKAW